MIYRLVFNLTCNCFQNLCSSYEVGLEPGCLASRFGELLGGVTTADVDLEGRVRTV